MFAGSIPAARAVTIAQLVEPRLVVPVVVDSNSIGHQMVSGEIGRRGRM